MSIFRQRHKSEINCKNTRDWLLLIIFFFVGNSLSIINQKPASCRFFFSSFRNVMIGHKRKHECYCKDGPDSGHKIHNIHSHELISYALQERIHEDGFCVHIWTAVLLVNWTILWAQNFFNSEVAVKFILPDRNLIENFTAKHGNKIVL